jgi:transcriptional regulator with XRE-family HTH domain
MDTITKLKALKKGITYQKLAKITGAQEQALIRWVTGKSKISPAWQAIIEKNIA